ncbi:transglycosylase domain-containing protein [Nonomuraea indica]|uniref:transglycosylase domain-containing protein n=1 Tax=Nonomuraea indica TaxID=1581193 RepID=UPI001FE874C0|nr:transglycosylase domain-containing protein [Nonomuraea indica]
MAGVARLAGAGVAAGVLVAAIALPAVGGGGAVFVSAAEELDIRPMELKEPSLAQASTVYDARGRQIAQFYDQYRKVVPLSQVSEVMRTAIVAIEDDRFYQHGAIDIEGTIRALAKNLSAGGVSQGGSSITQQYVKQVLLNSATTDADRDKALEASYARKLNELRHALAVEQKYTKDQILEKYLNIVYFGDGANGVEAAARRFFGIPAARLNLAQAATLAGAVQDPNRTDPGRGRKARELLLERRDVVLDRMAQLGRITPEQAAEAKKAKLGYKGVPQPNGCQAGRHPYFCEYVRYELLTNPAFGGTAQIRRQRFTQGGLKIYTTLDPRMQAAADQAIRKRVFASDDAVASQALVQPGTGMIRAMAASRKFGDSVRAKEISYNPVADSRHGGLIGFQAGSTFKTFTLIAALKDGMKLDDGITVGNGYTAPSPSSFRNCEGENMGIPSWTVTNDEGTPGFKTLKTGTWGSVNTFFMSLEQRVGLCETVETAKSLGIRRADGKPLQEYETFTLGINEMDPVTVANAYAAIAARGRYCAPMAITKVTDTATGRTDAYEPSCRQALDAEVADATAEVLTGVFTDGMMRSVGGIGRPAAGKTGTTDGYATAWFAGFTPDLAGAVSIGDPRGSQRHKLAGVTIGGRYFGAVAGASLPGPIWKDTMTAALRDTPARDFTPVNTSRFGGCAASCAPVREEPDEPAVEDPDGLRDELQLDDQLDGGLLGDGLDAGTGAEADGGTGTGPDAGLDDGAR